MRQTDLFSHFRPFFAFSPSPHKNPKDQNNEKIKKTPRDIIILHKCTINNNHMIYDSWNVNCNRHNFFCHLGPFFALLICYTVLEKWHMMDVMLFFILGNCLPFKPPNNPKNEHFKKMRKITGDIIISHKCTKNYDHRLYCSWDMVHDTCNFYFSFWAIFCPFTP